MSRKGIAERLQVARRSQALQMARRGQERLGYDWWREVYIQDVSELLPQARVLEEREREVERLRLALAFIAAGHPSKGQKLAKKALAARKARRGEGD